MFASATASYNKFYPETTRYAVSYCWQTSFIIWTHLSPTGEHTCFAGTSTVNRSPHRHSSRCWLEAPAGSSTEKLAAASGRRRWPICWCCLARGPGSFDVEDATTLSWSSAAVSEWVSRLGAGGPRTKFVVTRVHCGQTVHPRPIVTFDPLGWQLTGEWAPREAIFVKLLWPLVWSRIHAHVLICARDLAFNDGQTFWTRLMSANVGGCMKLWWPVSHWRRCNSAGVFELL